MPGTASSPATGLDTRRRRILFRATHRGTHENDLLVGGFVEPRIATMSEAELHAIEAVLDLPDPELADWLTGRVPLPPEQETPMLRAMVEAAWMKAAGLKAGGR
jgi:antitoxin CptB